MVKLYSHVSHSPLTSVCWEVLEIIRSHSLWRSIIVAICQRQFHTGAAMVIELAGLTSGFIFKIRNAGASNLKMSEANVAKQEARLAEWGYSFWV